MAIIASAGRQDMERSTSRTSVAARGRHVLIGVVALFATLAFAASASAIPLTPTSAPLPGSDFQGGDGNQTATPLLRDWQSLVGQPGLVAVSDPNALDTTYGTGSHENDPLNWDVLLDPGGVTPAKANFFNAWFYVDERDDTFLYLAFNREESGGNVFLAFELNQDTRLWTNASGDQIQCRTTGDIIISYEIQNDDNIDVIIQRWVSDSVVSAAEAAGGLTNGAGCAKTGHFEEFNLTPAQVQGAINAGTTITNFLPGAPAVIGEELFGEAAINLTAVFEDVLEDPCFSFGQVSLHGRSSESDSAALQDLVGPVPLLVRNCTISGTKFHDLDADGLIEAGEPTIAGWKLYIDLNGNNQLDAGEPTTLTDADGNYTFEDLSDGTFTIREAPDAEQAAGLKGFVCSFPSRVDASVYTATETVHPEFSLTDITCSGDTIAPNSSDAGATATFNAQSGETITCVFTNEKDATVKVVKDAIPDDPQDFSFSTSGLGAGFDLDDDGDAALPNSKSFTVSGADFG